jgi:hypothetical protein
VRPREILRRVRRLRTQETERDAFGRTERARELLCDADPDEFAYIEPPFNLNPPNITRYPVEVTGYRLLQRIWWRIGWPSLEGRRLLDYGCGVRFARTIHNLGLPIARYVGVDVNREIVDWMQQHFPADRFAFFHVDVRNELYNADGTPDLPPHTLSDLGVPMCHAACMHSVITHQNPHEARVTFAMLRPVVVDAGRLHFTAFVDDAVDGFVERDRERPGELPTYHPDSLIELVERGGWRVDRIYPKDPWGLGQVSFVCTAV